LTRITGTLYENKLTFFIVSRSVILGLINVSRQSCRENPNTHLCSIKLVFENSDIYEIMWKKYCTARQATVDKMGHAHCMLNN